MTPADCPVGTKVEWGDHEGYDRGIVTRVAKAEKLGQVRVEWEYEGYVTWCDPADLRPLGTDVYYPGDYHDDWESWTPETEPDYPDAGDAHHYAEGDW